MTPVTVHLIKLRAHTILVSVQIGLLGFGLGLDVGLGLVNITQSHFIHHITQRKCKYNVDVMLFSAFCPPHALGLVAMKW